MIIMGVTLHGNKSESEEKVSTYFFNKDQPPGETTLWWLLYILIESLF